MFVMLVCEPSAGEAGLFTPPSYWAPLSATMPGMSPAKFKQLPYDFEPSRYFFLLLQQQQSNM